MKYIQNFHDKTEPEVLAGIGNIDYPVIIGGGNTNEGIKVFIVDNQDSLHTKLTNANSIEEAFDINYKPYIINGYDQRMVLDTAFGFCESTWPAYAAGELQSTPYFYNYCKVSPITYSSSDTNVATINNNGVVTVIGNGTTIIKFSFAGNEKFQPREVQYTLTVDIPVVVDPEPDYYLTYNGHKYVDMGLPSGRKWSVYNMGATAVNETGDDYFWGNTTPDVDIYYTEGYDADAYTKYNDSDYKRTLDMSDDAARVNWGGNWRLPSEDEYEELMNNSNIALVTNYLGRGADGLLFTSKNNGHELFFPLDNNGEWGTIKCLTNELWNAETPYMLIYSRYRDTEGDTAGTIWTSDDYDSLRWYSGTNIRPVF